MIQISNIVNSKEIENIFGMLYCQLNQRDQLTENFNNILNLRSNLLSKIQYFLDNTPSTSRYSLSLEDLDLLLIKNTSCQTNSFISFYNGNELNLFSILKKIIESKENITVEDFKLLNSFIRNKNKTQELITLSSLTHLSIDKTSLIILINLIESHSLTVGHTIKKYEDLCDSLNYSRTTTNPSLKYRICI